MDETALNEWVSELFDDTIHIYWDVQSKVKMDFLPFYVHEHPTIVFLSNVDSIKQNYTTMHDGLFANKTIIDGNLLFIPCKSELKARLMVLKVLGMLSAKDCLFYFFTEDCELSVNLKRLQEFGGNRIKIVNRHLHNNIRNKTKDFDQVYQSIYEALLCMARNNGHPVVSKLEYCQLFKSVQYHSAVFNHLLEDAKLVPEKSMKLSKMYELKEYPEDFTFTIVGNKGKLKDTHIKWLGEDIAAKCQ